MHYFIGLLLLTSLSFAEDFNLEDLNESSSFYGQEVGPSYFENTVSIVYFGHYNWGLCTTRFGQLNDIYETLIADGYNQVNLFGVGKDSHIGSLSNWTANNDVSVVADSSPFLIWNDWDASQRDLYLLDHNQNIVFHDNIGSGIPSNFAQDVIALINEIPSEEECIDGEIDNSNPCNPRECYDGMWVEIIIDCAEQMGVPCDGGLYIAPPEDECCSTCVQYGDSNSDGTLDVLDVVILLNYILNPDGEGNEISDMNFDGLLNVLDVVTLVNIILSP